MTAPLTTSPVTGAPHMTDLTYLLRTCRADGTSFNGFRWPTSGPVEAPDWNPAPECGGGLHGLLMGEGDGGLLCWDADARWLVVAVDPATVVDLGQKVKVPRGEVVYCGPRDGALAALVARGADPSRVVGGQATAGVRGQATARDWGQATAGDRGQATAGDWGQATAGDWGQATAGDRGQATAGVRGQATAGDRGQATAGDGGQATAGDRGQATAGVRGQATAGDRGQATAGDWGQATAGDGGQATAGVRGQATAGDWGQAVSRYRARAGALGVVVVWWWDGNRERAAVGYVGENGIEPDTWYEAREGRLVAVPEAAP